MRSELTNYDEVRARRIYQYAIKLYFGEEDSKDEKKAVLLLKKAAEMEYAPAQFALGVIYSSANEAIEKNQELASEWFGRAKKNGHCMASTYREALLEN